MLIPLSASPRVCAAVALLAAGLGAPSLRAQFPPLIPRPATLDTLVVDNRVDRIWRLSDLDQDGSFDDPGEFRVFYDGLAGPVNLFAPVSLVVGRHDVVYVGESFQRTIVSLVDLDGDGDAQDRGEQQVFFDGVRNGSGIRMELPHGLTADLSGNVFVAAADTDRGGQDVILRLADRNGDGDANDAGEAQVYCRIPSAPEARDTNPTALVVGPDGRVYFTDTGLGAGKVRGVYRCDDRNGDGDANDPGELSVFWTPPSGGDPRYWGLAVAPDGTFYVTDSTGNQVWRGRDVNGDGAIRGVAEVGLFYFSAAALYWDVVLREDGTVLLCDDQPPNRITALRDLNGDGDATDPGEATQAYDESVGPLALQPRGASLMAAPDLSVSPALVRLGRTTTLTLFTPRPGDAFGLVVSTGLATMPRPLAPFGVLALEPGSLFGFASGRASGSADFQLALAVPNDPALVGRLAFQALAGNAFRPFLSNAAVLTINP